MKFENKAIALGACLAALMLSACASSENKAYTTFTLNGMVYDHSGSAVNGMEIKLVPGETVKSDYSGRFSFASMKPGSYALRASLEGYEPFSGEIRVSSPADIVYISVFSRSDLLRAVKDSMRSGEWDQASSFADRALAIGPSDPRALYLKALLLSSRQNPGRDLAASAKILKAMVSGGTEDPSVRKLLSDIESESGN